MQVRVIWAKGLVFPVLWKPQISLCPSCDQKQGPSCAAWVAGGSKPQSAWELVMWTLSTSGLGSLERPSVRCPTPPGHPFPTGSPVRVQSFDPVVVLLNVRGCSHLWAGSFSVGSTGVWSRCSSWGPWTHPATAHPGAEALPGKSLSHSWGLLLPFPSHQLPLGAGRESYRPRHCKSLF